MARGLGGHSPSNVQKHLEGVSHPASKQDLIDGAKRNNAPREVIDTIQQLDADRFGGPQDVMKAYGKVE